MTRLWLDDERTMPSDYDLHVKTAEEAIIALKTGKITGISLDNDMGIGRMEGYEVAKFIEEEAYKYSQGLEAIPPIQHLSVHTQNVAAKQKIKEALRNAKKHWMEKTHE